MNFYDVLAAEKWGGGIPSINFFDLLFAQSMGGEQWETYEGTLPATIISTGDNLRQYQVWGNTGGVGEEVDITGLSEPLCGIGSYTDSLDLSTGILTRKIKKLVLTGAENITNLGDYYNCGVTISSIAWRTASSTVGGGFIASNNGRSLWAIKSNFSAFTTVTDFKSYLQQQYAAGTPVTVWYVLAEPEVSTITIPSGLTGTIEGYLIQDGTPTPETPIYPTANGVKQADGTYSIKYGYGVDISTSDGTSTTTTPIYIGDDPLEKVGNYADYVDYQAQKVVRVIKKYVLTGNENWEEITGAYASRKYFRWIFAPINYCIRHVCVSSHFTQVAITTSTTTVGFDVFDSSTVGGEVLAIRPTNVQSTTLADFKSYLAAQYAAGTPVTIWCALRTAEEADPPVPLPALPTLDGTTIVDYAGESVAPEKVYFEYQGGKQP